MSDTLRTVKNNIQINWIKAISGILMIVVGIASYINRKKNKYVAAAGITTGVLGVALIGTELESNFKPLEVDEENDEQ